MEANTETATLPERESSPKVIGESFDPIRKRLEETRDRLAEQPQPSPEEIERERRERERRERAAMLERFLKHHRLMDRFGECTLENFERPDSRQSAAVNALKVYCKSMESEITDGSGLLCLGEVGRGKDHLMVGVIRSAILDYGFDVEWKNGLDLFGDIRDHISSDSKERELIQRYELPKVLAISDPVPPVGQLTQHQTIMFQRIIDARYRSKRVTWVTANAKDYSDLGNRLGFAVADRLSDNALVIRCSWEGYRKPKRVVN